jgi:hypothetical protein
LRRRPFIWSRGLKDACAQESADSSVIEVHALHRVECHVGVHDDALGDHYDESRLDVRHVGVEAEALLADDVVVFHFVADVQRELVAHLVRGVREVPHLKGLILSHTDVILEFGIGADFKVRVSKRVVSFRSRLQTVVHTAGAGSVTRRSLEHEVRLHAEAAVRDEFRVEYFQSDIAEGETLVTDGSREERNDQASADRFCNAVSGANFAIKKDSAEVRPLFAAAGIDRLFGAHMIDGRAVKRAGQAHVNLVEW